MLLLPPDGRRIGALQRRELHILTASLLHPASAAHTGVVGAGWVCRSPFAKCSGIDEGGPSSMFLSLGSSSCNHLFRGVAAPTQPAGAVSWGSRLGGIV